MHLLGTQSPYAAKFRNKRTFTLRTEANSLDEGELSHAEPLRPNSHGFRQDLTQVR